jgi:putative sugar O-methyltransferase
MRASGPSLRTLHAAYERCVAFVGEARAGGAEAHVSDFWREIFDDRPNYPSFNEMLLLRRGFSYAIGDSGSADAHAEHRTARAHWDVVRRVVPGAHFDRFEESSVGSPFAFTFGGRTLSAAGTVNALTSYRIVSACERAGLARRPLRVLEIGAGYGGVADQLLQMLDISLYAICDLPENGFLSGFCLQAAHPEREALFLGGSGVPQGAAPGLLFALPDDLELLDGEFDLIVNSYSFQEMTAASVHDYVDFAARRLIADGLLYSLNSHGKAGVRRPSDYEVERFAVEQLACPRPFPWQINGTVPYELVLRRRTAPELTGARLARRRTQLDGLGRAMQLGLTDELGALLDAFAGGEEGAPNEGLDALAGAFAGRIDERREAARRVPGAVGAHLTGVLSFVDGDDSGAADALAQALQGLGQSHARVWALTVLGSLDAAGGEHRRAMARAAGAATLAPHLAADIARLVGAPETARAMLASLAGCADRTPQATA